MSETLTHLIVDCATGEQTLVPFTAEEVAQREADAQAYAESQAILDAEIAAKEAAKASANAKLKALGLSDAEIAALTA
jgi:hypothetical protein